MPLRSAYSVVTVTGPSVEPVTLAEAKKQLEFAESMTAHDDQLHRLIALSRQRVEALTNRQIMTATLELRLDRFPVGAILLPRSPVQSITSIKYQETADTETTISSDTYRLLSSREPAEVVCKTGYVWPVPIYEPDVVRIRYVAGWTTRGDVPEAIKHAMLMMVTDWMLNRTGEGEMSAGAASLLRQVSVGDTFHDFANGF